VYTWSQFQNLVLSILTDTVPSDDVFTLACAEYVKAKAAREYDRSLERHDSYWKSYIGLRDRLVGYQYFPGSTNAQSSITWTGQPAVNDTITIAGKVYTFVSVLTGVDGQVLIGALPQGTIISLAAAINLAAGAGILYSPAMSRNNSVSASASNLTLTATALGSTAGVSGAAGNAITVASSGTAQWASPTLTGGSDAPLVAQVNSLISIDANRAGATQFVSLMLK